MGELLRRSACASSPTTAPAWPDAGVMRRALEYARVAAGRGHRAARRGRRPRRPVGTCTRASGRAASASPVVPAEAEDVIVARDLELRAAHRRAGALPAPVDRRRRSTSCGRPRRAGLPVTAEAAPHHFTLTDAVLRGLRPGVQGEPAAAHRRRRRRRPGRPRRRHHRRHRHRPRAAHAGGEGAPVRGGAAGDARARDRARAHDHRAGRAGHPRPARRRSRCSRGGRPRIAGLDATTGGPIAAGRPGQPLRDRPRGTRGWSTPTAWRAGPATRRSPAASSPAGSATPSSRGEPVVIDGEAQR